MRLNRTLRQLRNARERGYPAMYEYAPDTADAPATLRFMTLAEAQGLECNRCGQCCGSDQADLEGFVLQQYAFGAIPEHQWRALHGGAPLIIPLTPSGRDRRWRPADAEALPHPAFRCAALQHEADGTTRCGLWGTRRPEQCDAFPLDAKRSAAELRRGAYILLGTTYQRLCTWVDVVLCPEDSVILDWRRQDGTLRGRLSAAQRGYVTRVVREAYRDAYPGGGGTLAAAEWHRIRQAELGLRGRAAKRRG